MSHGLGRLALGCAAALAAAGLVQPAQAESNAGGKTSGQNCAFRTVAAPDDSLHATGLAAVDRNDVWEFGDPTMGYGSPELPARARHWNGSAWATVPMPGTGFYAGGAAISATDVWAVGPIGFSHWDGQAWTLTHGPFTGHRVPITVSAAGPHDVWATGTRLFGGAQNAGGDDLYHFDGSTWSVVTVPPPATGYDTINGIQALATNDVWAVGQHDSSSYNEYESAIIKHWDGATWHDVVSDFSDPGHPYRLMAVGGVADDLWLAGIDFNHSGEFLLEHWDGTTVTRVNSGLPPELPSEPTSISRHSRSDAWMAGVAYRYDSNAGGYLSYVAAAHWDGSKWTAVPLADGAQDYGGLSSIAAVGYDRAWVTADGYSGTTSTQGHTEMFSCGSGAR